MFVDNPMHTVYQLIYDVHGEEMANKYKEGKLIENPDAANLVETK